LLVRLTDEEKLVIRQIYDVGEFSSPVTGRLAACIALLHLAGSEALGGDPLPTIEVDSFTVFCSAGPDLLRVIKREGQAVVCRRFGKRQWRRDRFGSRADMPESCGNVAF
jgi:hypothetical protein